MTRFPGTDKDQPHNYLPDYLRIMELLGPKATICELGVWKGGSLAMWQELFPLGTVIGVDEDPGCTWPEGTRKLVMQQEAPDLRQRVSQLAPGGLDLVVDDASHIGNLTQASFNSLWPLVKPGCFYVVEDWTTAYGLGQWVPWLLTALESRAEAAIQPGAGAASVTYTKEGLVILQKVP